ncbi:MAG: hotdog fold thioesterase [Deferribacteres bacterium]|nr:hotdog fold thioesterase [Deferribacteres bacterium]
MKNGSKVKRAVDYISKNDRLFKFLGAEVVDFAPGYARLEMTVADKHLNAVGVCQGGVIFTLADLAFAVASNSYGELVLAVNCDISYIKAAKLGDVLVAEAKEHNRGSRLSHYLVEVFNAATGEKVALFKGVGYNLGKGFVED